jgi:hypothetical protein
MLNSKPGTLEPIPKPGRISLSLFISFFLPWYFEEEGDEEGEGDFAQEVLG